MTRHKRGVLFDLYGTLVDVQVDEGQSAFWDALAKFALPSRRLSGKSLRRAYDRIVADEVRWSDEGFLLKKVFARLLKEVGAASDERAIRRFADVFRSQSLVELKKKEYTDNILRLLRGAGQSLALVSNTEALLTDFDLNAVGLQNRFDAVVLSSEFGVKKPDQRIFREALRLLGLEPRDAVFVGDDFGDDVAGALGAGIDAIFLSESPEAPEQSGSSSARSIRAAFDEKSILGALVECGVPIG